MLRMNDSEAKDLGADWAHCTSANQSEKRNESQHSGLQRLLFFIE